jgi:hypothetical protein
VRRSMAIVGTALLIATGVDACGVCGCFKGNPLGLPHSRAIEIAVATRAALDAGLLSEASGSGPTTRWNRGEKPSARKSIERLVECLRTREDADSLTIHVLLVDTEESCLIHVRSGGVAVEFGGRRADAVLATTVVGLQGLIDGRLSCDEAIQRAIVVIDGDQERLLRLLRRGLTQTARSVRGR